MAQNSALESKGVHISFLKGTLASLDQVLEFFVHSWWLASMNSFGSHENNKV